MLIANYEYALVIISILVAIFASYTSLDMASRISANNQYPVHWWLQGGAFAMGVGIWSMHFVGMLAFRLPIALGYDVALTLLSLVLAVAASGFALWLVTQPELPIRHLVIGALVMGTGIVSMHYVGMAALRMQPTLSYKPAWFIASLIIAVLASGAALWITFSLRKNSHAVIFPKIMAAVVMGIAIVAMHYTGMAAAEFPIGSICMAAKNGADPDTLAIMVVLSTVAVLVIALLISVLDARLESRTAVLAQSLAKANHELHQLTLHDHLTKLPNRVLLQDRVNQAVQKATRENSSFALMFIDLDGFKAINDSFGHHIGDLLLVETAERLKVVLRMQDTVGRMGGDEFVILLHCDLPEDAAVVAEKLITAVNQPFKLAAHELRISASIGISVCPVDGTNYHELTMNADAAMYHIKHSGRNGFRFFEASMNINAHKQQELLQYLRLALERDQFILLYQPKFDAQSGSIIGAEALLRWQHPQLGMVAPDQFIPLAEKTGLIITIGGWVLREACRQMRAWHQLGHTEWSIAVNLSPMQFSHDNLVNLVSETLADCQLPPRYLTLEVTESTAMNNVKASLEILKKIADIGVDISIDDFGTGYSSLLYLKRLPASELKIDRAFINNLGHGAEDDAIVSAIVALGHTLNLRIVAEGVESDSQLLYLQSLGCDVIQGFLLGKPMAPQQLEQRWQA